MRRQRDRDAAGCTTQLCDPSGKCEPRQSLHLDLLPVGPDYSGLRDPSGSLHHRYERQGSLTWHEIYESTGYLLFVGNEHYDSVLAHHPKSIHDGDANGQPAMVIIP